MPVLPEKIVIVTGATASGKTKLGVEVALAVDGEVINADSQQIYRGMEIGTARPRQSEMHGVPHHLYSTVDPREEVNAARYSEMADRAIAEISSRGKVPVLVGGTQLYIRALTRGLCGIPDVPDSVRDAVKKEIEVRGLEAAHERLKSVDPSAAGRITPRDAQRIARALEVYDATGNPLSEFQKSHGFLEVRYESVKIAIRIPRDTLHRRIDERTRQLFAEGFIEEVRGLIEAGFSPTLRSFKAHGYRYVADVVEGRMTMERAIELTARDTRRYAKRQETWLRSDLEIRWVDWPDFTGAIEAARDFLSGGLGKE